MKQYCNEKTAIVTGGTKKDVDAMAVLALNIKCTSPNLATELVIFHDGIKPQIQESIREIMPIRFIKYRCPINRISMILNKTVRYFSPMVFCKYECFRLLEEYDTVIWTDYDVLIKEDIEELKYIQSNMAFIVNSDTKLQKMFYPSIKRKDMHLFDMNGLSITTPLFVLRKEMGDYKNYYAWCIEMTKKFMPYLYLPEQCIFTMLIQHFDLPYTCLDMKVYCMHPNCAEINTKILHAYGQPKFWNGLDNQEWNNYFSKWKMIERGE